MPRLSYTHGSNASTGTDTWLNLSLTLPGATESEMTTRSLPFALAVVLAESLTTMTVWPSDSSRLIAAASPLETGTAPETKRVSAFAAIAMHDVTAARTALNKGAADIRLIVASMPGSA